MFLQLRIVTARNICADSHGNRYLGLFYLVVLEDVKKAFSSTLTVVNWSQVPEKHILVNSNAASL